MTKYYDNIRWQYKSWNIIKVFHPHPRWWTHNRCWINQLSCTVGRTRQCSFQFPPTAKNKRLVVTTVWENSVEGADDGSHHNLKQTLPRLFGCTTNVSTKELTWTDESKSKLNESVRKWLGSWVGRWRHEATWGTSPAQLTQLMFAFS